MHLDWHTVKELESSTCASSSRVRASDAERIGVDEISIEKRHVYRIVVSDLERKRAIWFGGNGRGETDMDMFYAFLGNESADKIRLAVMDMWKPFRQSTQRNAPQAAFC